MQIKMKVGWDVPQQIGLDAEGRVLLTGVPEGDQEQIRKVIEVYVAAEREACARLAEAESPPGWDYDVSPWVNAREQIAAAIRGRGK